MQLGTGHTLRTHSVKIRSTTCKGQGKQQSSTMSLVVATAPPDLVVQTKVKRVRIPVEETPFLCDRFWACVLDDYLDEDVSDDGIVGKQQRDDEGPKPRRTKKSNRKKQFKDIFKEFPGRSDYFMGGELDNLLSDGHDFDRREKGADARHPRDSSDPLDDEKELRGLEQDDSPKEVTSREKKLKKRLQSAPPEFEVASKFMSSIQQHLESGPEHDADYPATDSRTQNSQVFHYAPLSYSDEATKRASFGSHVKSHRHTEPPMDELRVPLDPEEGKSIVPRQPHGRFGTEKTRSSRYADIMHNTPAILPRSSNGARVTSHVGSNDRSQRMQRRTEPRVETIHLTNEDYDTSMPQGTKDGRRNHSKTEAHGNVMKHDDSMGWILRESKKAESDYRSRKLDRKEALNRIRAIKARLRSGDP